MKPKVYYLDDEPHLRDAFTEYMARKGLEVETFGEAEAALDACQTAPPDILFIDYRLSDTTGDQVARAVDGRIKKVLVTGYLTGPFSEDFDEILRKPYRLSRAYELIGALSADI